MDSILKVIFQGEDSSLSGTVKNLQGQFSNLGAVLSGALLTGLLAVGGAAFGMASAVQSSTALVGAQLGLGADEAQAYGDIIKDVYGANFGDSIASVGSAVSTVTTQLGRLGDVSTDVVEAATINALRLADTFGIDVSESTVAAVALMDDFGLSQEQAFDLITTGFQGGMNASGDFLDSLGEYGTQFSSLGFDAANFFSILETGQGNSVLGTDKIADLVKEWGILMVEGGEKAAGALGALGIEYDDMATAVGSGEAVWADYFDEIVGGLSDIEDPIEQQRLAVALFGTMAEDLGPGFIESLDMMATGLGEMSGATEALDSQYNTLGSALEGFKRQGLIALEPLGAGLLTLANFILPSVQSAFDTLTPIFETIGVVVSGFFANMEAGMGPVEALSEVLWSTVSPEMAANFDALALGVTNFMASAELALAPVVGFLEKNVELNDILTALGIVIGVVLLNALAGLVIAAAPVILTVGALIAGVALLRLAWENDVGGIQEKWATFSAYIVPAFTELKNWLEINIPLGIQVLTDYWNTTLLPALTAGAEWFTGTLIPTLTDLYNWVSVNLTKGLSILSDYWTGTLLPAIKTVSGFVTGTLLPLFLSFVDLGFAAWKLAITALKGAWENVLLPALTTVFGYVRGTMLPAMQRAEDGLKKGLLNAVTSVADFFLGPLQDGFKIIDTLLGGALSDALESVSGLFDDLGGSAGGISGILDTVRSGIDMLATALGNITLPDWLTPGSPTPFEIGLRGIDSAMKQVTSHSIPFAGSFSLIPPTSPLGGQGVGVPQNQGSSAPSTVFHIAASYPKMAESDLVSDIRALQLLSKL